MQEEEEKKTSNYVSSKPIPYNRNQKPAIVPATTAMLDPTRTLLPAPREYGKGNFVGFA